MKILNSDQYKLDRIIVHRRQQLGCKYEPLDGDEVDNLVKDIENFINTHEGNYSKEEIEKYEKEEEERENNV